MTPELLRFNIGKALGNKNKTTIHIINNRIDVTITKTPDKIMREWRHYYDQILSAMLNTNGLMRGKVAKLILAEEKIHCQNFETTGEIRILVEISQ